MEHIDNVNIRLGDDLKRCIQKSSKVSIVAASFSIYAFEALRKELKSLEELRFIFSSPSFIEEDLRKELPEFYIPHIYKESELCGGEFEVRLKNQLNQRAIAKECSKWVEQKVRFKSNKKINNPLNGIIHIQNADNGVAYSGISSFTSTDLGFTPKTGFPSIITKTEYPVSQRFLEWFDQVWRNERDLQEVTQNVQDFFESAYKENSPEFIYFITLYNIFNDFLEDISSDNIPNEHLGFKDTVIWNKLFNFQKDAVIGAINKLEKYKGCILADSVGLGKTFSALGVIKYYEMRNKDVLVLCPKKLEANWNGYRFNDKTNILSADRLRYDVLFHTDLTRTSGNSNGRQLENVNWGNYGLIVIDESHNFRNNNPNAERENRYQALLRKVVREGIETKVLMLSATPVNNRFGDLKNQLALAYEGDAANIDNKLNTERGIEQIFRRAQTSFREWSRLPANQRTSAALLENLDFDFFELLDSLTIARSRKHITTYYDTTAIGKFPNRNIPISRESKLCHKANINYIDIADRLILLNLSVYTPLNYILASKEHLYAEKYQQAVRSGTARLSQRDRDNSLRILMRINLLKRLESSVDSFRITIKAIIDQVTNTLVAIDNNSSGEIDGLEAKLTEEDFDWDADWGDEENVIGRKIKVHLADVDTVRWREDLNEDLQILSKLVLDLNDINPTEDNKLQDLLKLIDSKISAPINPDNKKIIIFTAFADTANYLYENIQPYVKEKYRINTALITGSRKLSSSRSIPKDINALLTCFSPLSKNKAQLFPHLHDEIDVLIATDCISEGQNLQDCDYLVNYDIHWNPVRIIQRFGRIDRIGSINETITLVNFWPDVTLDAYINLKNKVENRMFIVDATATGDDNILIANERDLEYRKIQLQRLKKEVIDLEDLREGISITDLGLNEFRVDLSNFIKEYGPLKNIPEGLHGVVSGSAEATAGVIFVLKNINNEINIDKLNRLHPYYIVYLSDDGEIQFSHVASKKVLDIMRKLSKGQAEPLPEVCKEICKRTDDYHNMQHYSSLLQKAVGSILNVSEEKSVQSLFSAGGTTALTSKMRGVEDFKLISFLIIK